MAHTAVSVSLLLALIIVCSADVYMHNPRGSNNRLNENTATRTNNNRAFDSQNNARGGYNVGDRLSTASTNQDEQYRMSYYESGPNLMVGSGSGRTELIIEWTNQHGCGGNEDTDPHKLNCNIVIQSLCQKKSSTVAPNDGITLRDGQNTDKQTYNKLTLTSALQAKTQRDGDVNSDLVLQEPWFWYDSCSKRERNKGLFTATQNLNNDDATSTRQNPDGTRSGYECPEERDYFPYWHPTPFVDIAVLAQNESLCSYYKEHSFNRKPKYECVQSFSGGRQHYSPHSTRVNCENDGGQWTEYYSMLELAPAHTSQADCEGDHGDGLSYKWGKPWDPAKIDNHQAISDTCFVQPPEIECQAAGWTRSNHLGNGRDGYPLNYTWTIPHFPSNQDMQCILRIRYNISTDDYDPYKTDASQNGENSPVQNNPLVSVGENEQRLQLAINTAQTGRTFQDRSHVFHISNRGTNILSTERIHNLNVRGKRGNIVQAYPGVEYDFVPNRLVIDVGDSVHMQWTGSNTHNNAPPGGDGQTGSAGEGTGGTDRHNLLQTPGPDINYPFPKELMTMFKDVTILESFSPDPLSIEGLELMLASSGYYRCYTGCADSVESKEALNNLLNNAAASNKGAVIRFNQSGNYFYICTRNNSFTNRSQKGRLTIR